MEESTFAQTPATLTRLRACKTCKLIKTYDQFYAEFCENCPQKRPETVTAGSRADFVQTETTSDYEGMVTMLQPAHSWVARWLRMYSRTDDGSIVHVKTGLYAIKLPGEEAAAAAARYGGGDDGDGDDAYEDEEADAGEEETTGSSSAAGASASGGAAAGKRITEDEAEEDDDDDEDDDEDDDDDDDSSGSSDDEEEGSRGDGKASGSSAPAAAGAAAAAPASGSSSAAPLIPGVTGPARQVSALDRDDPAAREAAIAQASIAPDGDE